MAALKLVADGKANNEIASALHISGFKTHLAHLSEKLGATSRAGTVKSRREAALVRLD